MVNKELKAYLVGMAGLFGSIAIPAATAAVGYSIDRMLGGDGVVGTLIGGTSGMLPSIFYSCSLYDLANDIQGICPES